MWLITGEAGIFISGIPPNVDGFYKGGKEINEKKMIRNAFQDGDAFFNFGDLLYYDKDYFIYFKDRVGDTFRWDMFEEGIESTVIYYLVTQTILYKMCP